MTTYQVNGGRRTAATVVSMIGSVAALILVAHILFVAFHAAPGNVLAARAADWSNVLSLWFADLFSTSNHVFTIILDYGAAAVFWLIVTGVIARVLRNVG